jgi:hypothetical protein
MQSGNSGNFENRTILKVIETIDIDKKMTKADMQKYNIAQIFNQKFVKLSIGERTLSYNNITL